jgi:hypothetical protein
MIHPQMYVYTRDKTPSPLQSHPKLCKPLKVYNYFYRDERDNIVNGLQNHGDVLPPPVTDFSQSKYEHLLHQRWYVRNYRYAFTSHSLLWLPKSKHVKLPIYRHIDPIKQRRQHRKTHGKIEFTT